MKNLTYFVFFMLNWLLLNEAKAAAGAVQVVIDRSTVSRYGFSMSNLNYVNYSFIASTLVVDSIMAPNAFVQMVYADSATASIMDKCLSNSKSSHVVALIMQDTINSYVDVPNVSAIDLSRKPTFISCADGTPSSSIPITGAWAKSVSLSYVGATKLSTSNLSWWPSSLSFRENSKSISHQSNIYAQALDSVLQFTPAQWNLSFEVQAIGKRNLSFYVLNVNNQSGVHVRLDINLSNGTLMYGKAVGGMALSNLQIVPTSTGSFKVSAIVSMPFGVSYTRLSFASTGSSVADPNAGLNIFNPKFEPIYNYILYTPPPPTDPNIYYCDFCYTGGEAGGGGDGGGYGGGY